MFFIDQVHCRTSCSIITPSVIVINKYLYNILIRSPYTVSWVSLYQQLIQKTLCIVLMISVDVVGSRRPLVLLFVCFFASEQNNFVLVVILSLSLIVILFPPSYITIEEQSRMSCSVSLSQQSRNHKYVNCHPMAFVHVHFNHINCTSVHAKIVWS